MRTDFAVHQLPEVIAHLGTPRFISSLMGGTGRAIARVDVCSLFRYDQDGRPANFGTASCVSEEVTRLTAERYAAGLGLHDPMRRSLPGRERDCAPAVFHLTRDGIDHPAYREMCFTRTGTLERMSVLCPDEQAWYSINFYRTHHSGLFASNEIAALKELAPLISSLVLKHVAVSGMSEVVLAEPPQERITRRLRDRAPDLSDRETEICALVLLGHTSESIALKLNLSVNSVQTYRKRAYVKLSIGSQNELFRMCLD